MSVLDLTPVVETERLLLRGQSFEDFTVIRDIWSDPEVTRFVSSQPQTEEEIWTKFLRKSGHWALLGFGYWTVEEKETGAVVGEAGFGDFKRIITPSIKGEPEIGWAFAASAQGKGYATEAALGAIGWGDAHFGGKRMSCIIDVANTPSLRVAEKCGFTETCRTVYSGSDVVLLHRTP